MTKIKSLKKISSTQNTQEKNTSQISSNQQVAEHEKKLNKYLDQFKSVEHCIFEIQQLSYMTSRLADKMETINKLKKSKI